MKYAKLYLISLIGVIAVCLAIDTVAELLDISVKILTRDPYRAAGVPAYYAYASLFGSAVWIISGTATLTAALMLRVAYQCRMKDDSLYRLMLPGGIIGLVMGLDDLLLFHDAYADWFGIPEILFHIGYFGSIALMILYARKQLFSTPWLLLFGALVCFGLSSILDEVRIFPPAIREAEDLFKISGIMLWGMYFASLSWTFAKERAGKS